MPLQYRIVHTALIDRVTAEVDRATDEIVQFTADLVRIPTVNPPGEEYDACAHFLGDFLQRRAFEVEYIAAEGRPEHTARHPRINVIGSRRGGPGPVVHLNGHIDVVPAGDGWTVEPFGGAGARRQDLRTRRLRHEGGDRGGGVRRGSDRACRRARCRARSRSAGPSTKRAAALPAWRTWRRAAESPRAARDFVIIPEPLNVDRICIGHRGVYWFEVTARGRIGHGSMPFLGVSAIDGMGRLLQSVREELMPALASRRTDVPVVPPGARHATINVNGIDGGQPVDGIQTPCVADLCRAIFDRRFLIEEGFDATRQEIAELVDRIAADAQGVRFDVRDLMVVHPTRTPDDSPVIAALEQSIHSVLGRRARADREPRHLRSQTCRADRRDPALRGLRTGRARARASARRILPHRRHRQRRQSARAGDARPDGRREID